MRKTVFQVTNFQFSFFFRLADFRRSFGRGEVGAGAGAEDDITRQILLHILSYYSYSSSICISSFSSHHQAMKLYACMRSHNAQMGRSWRVIPKLCYYSNFSQPPQQRVVRGGFFVTFIHFLFVFDLVGADDGAKVVSTTTEALCAYLWH